MRRTVEVGTTVQEATDKALNALNVQEHERYEVIVLEEPGRGFLGITSRPAKVEVVVPGDAPAPAPQLATHDASLQAAVQAPPPAVPAPAASHAAASGFPAPEAPGGDFGAVRSPLGLGRHPEANARTYAPPPPPARRQGTPMGREQVPVAPSSRSAPAGDVDAQAQPAQEGGPRPPPPPTEEADAKIAAGVLREMLEKMGFGELELADGGPLDNGAWLVALEGGEAHRLIGTYGARLKAIEYIVNLVSSLEQNKTIRLALDVEGYRDERLARLQAIAERMAERAERMGTPVRLKPMDNSDRKVIHEYLARRGGVTTLSEGKEPNRCLVITPKVAQRRRPSDPPRGRGFGGPRPPMRGGPPSYGPPSRSLPPQAARRAGPARRLPSR